MPTKKAAPKPIKKAAVKKKATKKAVSTPRIAKSKLKVDGVGYEVVKSKDEGPGYEVIVGDNVVDDVEKGEEMHVSDEPMPEAPDPLSLQQDWHTPSVQAIPTPEEEAKIKAQGEADREAKRLAELAASEAEKEIKEEVTE